MAPSRQQLLSTARAFINDYRTWNVKALMNHRSPDCIVHSLPASRNQPPRNNEQYKAFFTLRIPMFKNFVPIEHENETFVDVEKRKVYMHIGSKAETAVGPYANEYAFVLSMTEAGDKVQNVWEFADSKYSEDFASKLVEATKNELK